MAESKEGKAGDSIEAIEVRQDEVLRQLEMLEERIAALLADYALNPVAPAAARKAA